MGPIEHIRASAAPAPDGSFSHAVAAGNLVFVSGQGPFDPASGATVGQNVREQTAQVVDNLEAILGAAGCRLTDVLKVGAHIDDFDLFEEFDAAYRERFLSPRPARITVAAGLGGILVELDCMAWRP